MDRDPLFPKLEYKRISFTKKQREAVFARTNGICVKEGCNRPAEEVNHIVALAMGGEHTPENWEGLCKVHHKIETADQIKIIRRADRKAGRTGQYARRKRNGPSLISPKKPWPKRPFTKKQKTSI